MKLWRADYQTEDGCFMAWATSKREAERLQRGAVTNAGDSGAAGAVYATDIPTTRPALVAWLNHHYNSDNG